MSILTQPKKIKSPFFAKNLRYLREKKNITQEAMFQHVGIKRTSIVEYERGNNIPRLEKLFILANFFEISVDLLWNNDLTQSNGLDAIYLNGSNTVLVKIIDHKAQAGIKFDFHNPEFREGLDRIATPKMGIGRPKDLLAFEVSGISMFPKINHKDMVICQKCSDDTDLQYLIGEIFVFYSKSGDLLVKRLYQVLSNSLTCIFTSDNHKEYPEEIYIEQNEIEELWRVTQIITSNTAKA